MQKDTKQPEITKRKEQKTAYIKKKVYKHLKEITRCESPNLRPIKQSTNKHSKQLIP